MNSNYRLGVAPTPLVFERGEGAYLYDADGNRLIDYYLGMGPMILGHNPAPVLEAVQAQLGSGILYAGQSRIEQEAARLVCEMVPCAERVRFSCAGSEVVQAVIRLARAATQRSVIIKFEGHYHGWMDNISVEYRADAGGVRPRGGAERHSRERGTGPAGRVAHGGAAVEQPGGAGEADRARRMWRA